jgi:beta-1,4-mannosyltransferase
MNRVYLYPKVFPTENPYISNLEKSLSSHYCIVNRKNNSTGVIELFRYLFTTDIYYFNWIENLPSRRYGKAQAVVFVFFLFLSKCFGKKIIWTLHNKYSHDKVSSKLTDYMFDIMFKHSDFILTHSQAGVDFAREKYPAYVKKVKYFIHPLNKLYPGDAEKEPVYDFFIWGTIWPYKGIIEFLKFLKESGNNEFRILIAGICINEQIKKELQPFLSDKITHLDKFLEFDEIAALARQSRFTLFTYCTDSVLSSGSLMDSIAMRSVVIGPDAGAFKDLGRYGFVRTYKTYSDIVNIYKSDSVPDPNTEKDLDDFWKENNWETFGERLYYDFTSA